MPGPIRLSEPCPACGAVALGDRVLSWHGTTAEGKPTGGMQWWVECAECKERFGRGADGALTTQEAAAEYEREQMRVTRAKIEAVFARRRTQQNNPPTSDASRG